MVKKKKINLIKMANDYEYNQNSFLDISELICAGSLIVEMMKEKPNHAKLIETIIAQQIIHYKRLGYNVKIWATKKGAKK